MMKKIDCFQCRHFYITWQRSFPYGCRALSFKSKLMPSFEVFSASGSDCLHYEKKTEGYVQ
jgi:hypothetical protein